MDIKQKKINLRKKIKEKIAELDAAYCQKADAQIAMRVTALPEYEAAKTIFCYVGMEQEINTLPILFDAWKNGKRVGVPRCIGKGIMKVYRVRSMEDLQSGHYGILEPRESCELLKPQELDLALIPCVTCNDSGERLGYGGGYYDRYLTRSTFPRVIMCRERIMEPDIPVDWQDQRMNVVVTESKTIRIGR
ncbi:MAG: 5-formyltetrahydrofolate cyclo-ligase [Hespellia sp.]|nr:5-formyltetrahydrofolate cyclo-ligase [Hespellia sp.]